MNTTTPGSMGGMKVAMAWPNMWLSGSRFRKRIGLERLRVFLIFLHLALNRDHVGEDIFVLNDHTFRLGRGAGGK